MADKTGKLIQENLRAAGLPPELAGKAAQLYGHVRRQGEWEPLYELYEGMTEELASAGRAPLAYSVDDIQEAVLMAEGRLAGHAKPKAALSPSQLSARLGGEMAEISGPLSYALERIRLVTGMNEDQSQTLPVYNATGTPDLTPSERDALQRLDEVVALSTGIMEAIRGEKLRGPAMVLLTRLGEALAPEKVEILSESYHNLLEGTLPERLAVTKLFRNALSEVGIDIAQFLEEGGMGSLGDLGSGLRETMAVQLGTPLKRIADGVESGKVTPGGARLAEGILEKSAALLALTRPLERTGIE